MTETNCCVSSFNHIQLWNAAWHHPAAHRVDQSHSWRVTDTNTVFLLFVTKDEIVAAVKCPEPRGLPVSPQTWEQRSFWTGRLMNLFLSLDVLDQVSCVTDPFDNTPPPTDGCFSFSLYESNSNNTWILHYPQCTWTERPSVEPLPVSCLSNSTRPVCWTFVSQLRQNWWHHYDIIRGRRLNPV